MLFLSCRWARALPLLLALSTAPAVGAPDDPSHRPRLSDSQLLAPFDGLPPGEYRFRVTGDGAVVRVAPPWWREGWAWLLFGLTALGLGAGYIRLNNRAHAAEMERRHHQLERERVDAERLRRAEEKYRTLFEGTGEGLFQLTADGRLMSANGALAEIFGYSSPERLIEAMAEPTTRLFDETRREELMTRLRDEGRVGGEVGELVREDGERRRLLFSAHAAYGADGALLHYNGVISDITELKEGEEAERERAAAERANHSKSQFLAAMSHEIRTPMNGVIGFTELLMKSGLNEAQRTYVETISRSATNLLAIINDILDFSKLEAGQMATDELPFDLQEVVDEVMVLLAPPAAEKGLRLAAVVESELPERLLGDPLRLRQVFTNLVGNAVKFTERGGIEVRLRAGECDGRGLTVAAEVRDSGVGIDAAALETLFQPFTQADASVTRRYGGSGLGLAICRGLVEGMGGEIDVESEPGRGTTVRFTIRCRLDTIAPAREPLLDGRRVVVWEEDGTVRDGVVAALRRWGVAAEGCADADDWRALADDAELLLRGVPREGAQAAITDTVRTVNGACPLALLAATFERGVLQRLCAAGARFALPKPCRFAELRRELCALWGAPEAPAAVEEERSLAGLRILVVDDNEVNRLLATTVLERRGVEVVEADSGEAAVEAVVAGPRFDAVLMDIQMPGMSGIEATEEIRLRQTSGEPTPVIALTAHALPHERERFLASGMEDFLSKPLREEELWAVLAQWVTLPEGATLPRAVLESVAAPTPPPPIEPPTAVADDTPPPYDRAQALTLTGGNEALADRLLSLFQEGLPETRETLLTTRAQGDREGLLKAVHKLHGAAANSGAVALERASEALESALKGDETIEREEALVRALLAEIDRFSQA